MILKIWHRYFLKEIIKVFFGCLFSFFIVYTVIDYSIHMQDFLKDQNLSIPSVLLYYLFIFCKRLDILIPLALLISVIKLLITLNQRRELVALLSCGISMRTLLRPFFLLSIAGAAIVFVNFQWGLPYSLSYIDRFYCSHLKRSLKKNKKEPIRIWHLSDGSKLIYQYYDPKRDCFFDCVWVRSSREIVKMKYLNSDPNYPLAQFVDNFQTDESGFFQKIQSHNSLLLPDLRWRHNMPRKGYLPIENIAPFELVQTLLRESDISNYKREAIYTHLFYKCAMPLLTPLAILAIIPYCITYRRKIPYFLIYAFSLFGLIIFCALMDALVILGENQILSPFWAIFGPIIFFSLLFGRKFVRSTK